mgnify:CR=1 FL=1
MYWPVTAVTLITTTEWPLPAGIRAAFTTRLGGVSEGACGGLNLGDHVGDDPAAVAANRRLLLQQLPGASAIQWLRQVHGVEVVEAAGAGVRLTADACVTDRAGIVCAIMTADCLPVLFASLDGQRVAAAHAGWRGLAAGVLLQTLARFPDPAQVTVYIGPAIGPDAFEVGPEVRNAFADAPDSCFRPGRGDRLMADLPALARWQLQCAGVSRIAGGTDCTFSDSRRFYSYRRDPRCGRQATLIWKENGV